MIKFDTNTGMFEICGDPVGLAAESTFLIKEIWQGLFEKSPVGAELFKLSVMSNMKLCFMSEESRKEEMKKEEAKIKFFKELLSGMMKDKEETKKPDVSADFMSDEEFHSFFDKLRGEGEDK